MKLAQLLMIFLFITVGASAATVKTTNKLKLGESEIIVNVYENAGTNITFFAPHYNEQIGIILAKEYINKNGGRLIEIESLDEKGYSTRNVKFSYGGKTYSIDSNRIYTDNGRSCNVAGEISETVKNFADNLLKIILAPDGKTLREGERFIVAVHNNANVSAKVASAQASDLSALAFIKGQSTKNLVRGVFEAQADGVFISNTETDEDNFIFLSSSAHLGYFAEKGFNIVVQKSAARLQSKHCTADDGSLSVYAAQTSVPYICFEADGVSGYMRQRQMFDAIYSLFQLEQKQVKLAIIADQK